MTTKTNAKKQKDLTKLVNKALAPLAEEMKKATQQGQAQISKEELLIRKIDRKYLSLIKAVETKKRDLIQKFAVELENEGKMPKDKISAHLKEVLIDYADESYIRACLDKKFKNQSHVRANSSASAKAKHTKKAEQNNNSNSNENESGQEIQPVYEIPLSDARVQDVDAYDEKACRRLLKDALTEIDELKETVADQKKLIEAYKRKETGAAK